MSLSTFLGLLVAGPEIDDADEETFVLFAQDIPSQNLGFIDAAAKTLELTVAASDFTIHQSPTVLASKRAGGTTGAVLWKITPLFAEWFSSPTNPLFQSGVLSASSAVLELGCGISPLTALVTAPRVGQYVLTDQPYVARFIEQNLAANADAVASYPRTSSTHRQGKSSKKQRSPILGSSQHHNRSSPSPSATFGPSSIRFAPLDWETDIVTPSLTHSGSTASFDAVVACDCIYNETLIPPFVQTCADACALRSVSNSDKVGAPCVCVVAQQLRDPTVFEAWLRRFMGKFQVWRVPDEKLVEGLKSKNGFAVHVGVLKEEDSH